MSFMEDFQCHRALDLYIALSSTKINMDKAAQNTPVYIGDD